MATVLTAKEFGNRIGLTQLEVIRRIRRGDINATKFGWNWAVPVDEVERVKNEDWYKRMISRKVREATA